MPGSIQRVGASHEFSKRYSKREMSTLGRCIRFSTWASAWWRLCRSATQSGRCRSYAESKSVALNVALASLIWFSDGGTRSVIPILGDETDASVQRTRPCNSDDSCEDRSEAKIARELRCLKASMSAFHCRPDDTESTTSIGT